MTNPRTTLRRCPYVAKIKCSVKTICEGCEIYFRFWHPNSKKQDNPTKNKE